MCSYYFVFLVKMIGQGRVRVLTRIEGRTPALPVEVQVLEDDWLKHYCTKHHSQHSKKRVKLTTACHRKEKEKKESYLDKFFSQQLCWRTLVPAIYADNIGVQTWRWRLNLVTTWSYSFGILSTYAYAAAWTTIPVSTFTQNNTPQGVDRKQTYSLESRVSWFKLPGMSPLKWLLDRSLRAQALVGQQSNHAYK